MNENTTFKQFLLESGFTLEQYKEDVYNACLKLDNKKYRNIDLYFYDEIEEAFNNQVPVNKIAAQIAAEFDTMISKVDEIELDEPDNEYTPEQLQAFADYPQDCFEDDEDYDEKENEFVDKYDFSNDYIGESTEQPDNGVSDGESYNEWKLNVFKYLDKRVDVNKIKELGAYIKDFIKQEYDKGEPSWFVVAESIVNYARTEYPDTLKNRESNAFNITENRKNEAFIQDDRGNVSITDLVDKIMNKAGMVVDYDDDYTAAAYYIADFYSKQSMPINGMVMWGARDLKKFKSIYDEQIQNANTSEEIQEYEKKAVTNVRSIMLGNPGKKWVWIEEIKDEVRKERKDAEEKRRQEYLNSEEHRHMQDPGWRGPNGTLSNE